MKAIFAAGGTGGHVNPAIAAAEELRRRHPDAQILFIGTATKIEAKTVPAAGFDFKSIDVSGFQRKLSVRNIFRNIAALFRVFKSSFQAKRIIAEFKPDVAVGFGGYVSGPVLREARKAGVKTVIHEQNAFPGVANKALAREADAVMLTDAAAKKYLECKAAPEVTGLPVRPEFLNADRVAAREKLGIPADGKVVLSIGGSLGAETVNRNMAAAIASLHGKARFIHGYGSRGAFTLGLLKDAGLDPENDPSLDIREYIDDMADCLAACDLIVARSGASTLAEIAAVGRPSVLIPSPNVAENHQYFNAKSFSDAGAAELIEEKDLDPALLCEKIDAILGDPGRAEEMGRAAKGLSVPDAAGRICSIIERVAGL